MKMKKILAALFILLLILILVLVVRTVTYKFGKVTRNVDDKELVNTAPSEQSVRRFVGGIRIPTISNEVYEETDFKPFDEFMKYLADSYPEVYRVMDADTINTYGLVFHWKGRNSDLKPILFLSHYDVVPVVGYDPSTATGFTTNRCLPSGLIRRSGIILPSRELLQADAYTVVEHLT